MNSHGMTQERGEGQPTTRVDMADQDLTEA